jgi:3-oxoadipate enol-lactonase
VTSAITPGTVTLADGSTLAYTRHRPMVEGTPPLVLIHSLALDRGIWDGVVGRLEGEADILAFDCRGHGLSDRRARPFTAELFARDLAELLDAVGWPQATIAGCSMGGCVALAFRARHPEVLQRTLKVFVASDLDCYAATCQLLGEVDTRAYLPAFRMPVAIVVGEEDYATPVDMARELHTAIPGSTLTIIPKARHLTPIEFPDRIASQLRALIRRAAPAARG